jgi:hypothetical protein
MEGVPSSACLHDRHVACHQANLPGTAVLVIIFVNHGSQCRQTQLSSLLLRRHNVRVEYNHHTRAPQPFFPIAASHSRNVSTHLNLSFFFQGHVRVSRICIMAASLYRSWPNNNRPIDVSQVLSRDAFNNRTNRAYKQNPSV